MDDIRRVTLVFRMSEVKTITRLRELAEQRYPGKAFKIYAVVPSRFPPITEKIIPYVEVVEINRLAANYSNRSPFNIAAAGL